MKDKQKIKVYLRAGSWVAFLAAQRLKATSIAIVVGKTIHLHKTSPEKFLSDKQWVLHELKHVEQYERLGFFGFIYTYLKESIRNGYYQNALEVEARRATYEETLLEKYEIVVMG